jgi:hypothetical protein
MDALVATMVHITLRWARRTMRLVIRLLAKPAKLATASTTPSSVQIFSKILHS